MILFLDFDGVLHPVNSRVEPKFCRLEILEEWLRLRGAVGVVISSSWREAFPISAMREFFADDLQGRILGVTPMVRRLHGEAWTRTEAEKTVTVYERQFEIEKWVADSDGDGRVWVALDDDAALFEPECPRLVLCEPSVGLTAAHLSLLDGVLGYV